MKYYYADANHQTAGPVSLGELRALIANGALKSDPMVVPEGGNEWKPLSAALAQIREASEPLPHASGPSTVTRAAADLPVSRTMLGDFVAAWLTRVSSRLNERFVSRSLRSAGDAGQWAILAGGALGLVYCIVKAIKTNQLQPVLVGVALVIALAIGQFVVMKFLVADEALIAGTPHRMSSKAFFDCYGLIALLIMAILVGAGSLAAIKMEHGGLAVLIPALVIGVLWLYQASLAFNPQVVNIQAVAVSAGEDAVGVLGFLLKSWLKLVPIYFLLVALMAIVLTLQSFGENSGAPGGAWLQQMQHFSKGPAPLMSEAWLKQMQQLQQQFGNNPAAPSDPALVQQLQQWQQWQQQFGNNPAAPSAGGQLFSSMPFGGAISSVCAILFAWGLGAYIGPLLLVVACAIPFAAYLLFLLFNLVLELIRAVLSLLDRPAKADH
jgi:hypothetical protein